METQTVTPLRAPTPHTRPALTDEERYTPRIAALRVVERMLLASANSGQAPNEQELEAASAVIEEALGAFEDLGILDLVCERDIARSAGGSRKDA